MGIVMTKQCVEEISAGVDISHVDEPKKNNETHFFKVACLFYIKMVL